MESGPLSSEGIRGEPGTFERLVMGTGRSDLRPVPFLRKLSAFSYQLKPDFANFLCLRIDMDFNSLRRH